VAASKSSHSEAINEVIQLLRAEGITSDSHLIVKTTIIVRLLKLLPTELLQSFLGAELKAAPEYGDPRFPHWVLQARRKLGLSQRAFADKLRTDELRVYGSDIGNLETAKRLEHYGPERGSKIRESIIQELVQANAG
jgi:hypothetical protein